MGVKGHSPATGGWMASGSEVRGAWALMWDGSSAGSNSSAWKNGVIGILAAQERTLMESWFCWDSQGVSRLQTGNSGWDTVCEAGGEDRNHRIQIPVSFPRAGYQRRKKGRRNLDEGEKAGVWTGDQSNIESISAYAGFEDL